MSNTDLLKSVFIEALELPAEVKVETLQYTIYPEWDSIAHMTLISQLEDAFDIMMDTEDIIDLSSFMKAIEILKKYQVSFE